MSSVAKHLLPFPITNPSFYPVSIYQPLLTPLMVLLPKAPLGRNAESFRMGLCCGHIQAYSLMFRSTSGVRNLRSGMGSAFRSSAGSIPRRWALPSARQICAISASHRPLKTSMSRSRSRSMSFIERCPDSWADNLQLRAWHSAAVAISASRPYFLSVLRSKFNRLATASVLRRASSGDVFCATSRYSRTAFRTLTSRLGLDIGCVGSFELGSFVLERSYCAGRLS